MPKQHVSLRLDTELIERLKKMAEIDKRNLSRYVELVLEYHANKVMTKTEKK